MAHNRKLNRMLQVVMYQLKRQYGNGPVDLYQGGTPSVDLETGERTSNPTVTRIKHVVILPERQNQSFIQTISKISADKTSVLGGYTDTSKRLFVIEQRDTPGLVLTTDDWLIYRNRRYSVSKFTAYEFDAIWVVLAQEVVGEVPSQTYQVQAEDVVELQDEGST